MQKKISRKDAKAQRFKTKVELNRRDEATEIAIYSLPQFPCLRLCSVFVSFVIFVSCEFLCYLLFEIRRCFA